MSIPGRKNSAMSDEIASETRSLNVVGSPPLGSSTSSKPGTDGMSTSPPTTTVVRQSSLRAKLSLPNLRKARARQEEPSSPSACLIGLGEIVSGANSDVVVTDMMHQDMLLQVQDMEFELVRPNFANYSAAARSSEDSAVLGRENPNSPLDVAPKIGFLRPESPAISVNSNQLSPINDQNAGNTAWNQANLRAPSPSSMTSSTRAAVPVIETESQMEAHRNRELKWMSLVSSSPPSQARKTKKVRKLLLEGVPASVRYLVWSHLTDGKARCVPGVYTQLCKRGRVPLTEEIEREVKKGWFLEEEQAQLGLLAEAGGGVVQLLQAYLNMVPDIQYLPGTLNLALGRNVADQSLLQVYLTLSVNFCSLHPKRMRSGSSSLSWIPTSGRISQLRRLRWRWTRRYFRGRWR